MLETAQTRSQCNGPMLKVNQPSMRRVDESEEVPKGTNLDKHKDERRQQGQKPEQTTTTRQIE